MPDFSAMPEVCGSRRGRLTRAKSGPRGASQVGAQAVTQEPGKGMAESIRDRIAVL